MTNPNLILRSLEKEREELLGMMPLCRCHDTEDNLLTQIENLEDRIEFWVEKILDWNSDN